MIRFLALTALICTGCAEKSAPADAPAAQKGAATAAVTGADAPAAEKPAEKKAKTVKKKKPPIKTKPTPAERKAKAAIKWPASGVEWVDSWSDAQSRSAETGKPICLVVYADWCPRCKELAPMFAEPDVVTASAGLIMVRQDHDERPEWLQAYAEQGTYVPRIFFFGADGNLRTDLTSGHARFPFFYSKRGKAALLRSMKSAVGS